MQDIRKTLGINIQSPYWDKALEKAVSEPLVPDWLTQEYLIGIQENYNLFPENFELILSAARQIVKIPELCLFAKILYHIIDEKLPFSKAFYDFELPKTCCNQQYALAYDCIGGFPIIAHLMFSVKQLEDRGIDRDIISQSLITTDKLFTYSYEITGKKCFDKQFFAAYSEALSTNHLILGRLRFEIIENSNAPAVIFKNKAGKYCVLMCDTVLHSSGHIYGSFGCCDKQGSYDADFIETDDSYLGYAVDSKTRLAQNFRTTLPKDEWECIYKPGDSVLKVHIPHGPSLKKELCEASYKKAREIFKKHYPEINFKCLLLTCWMLSPELRDILPETSNIITFQNDYLVFPAKSNAADAFQYVYGIITNDVSSIDVNNLTENNSLQKGIKQKVLQDKYIHQFNGFIEL